MEELERRLLEYIAQVYDWLGWPGVVLLMAIESACIPLPSELIMPLSGWMLIERPGLSPVFVVWAGAAGAVGNLIGSLVAYAVGAWGGRPLLERYGRYLLITRNELHAADRWFARYGDWAVFLSRLMPVVRTFISLPAGVARMPLGKFALLTLAGSFPWSAGLAYGGFLLGDNWEALRRAMRPFDIPILVALAALAALFVARRIRHVRREARDGGAGH